MLGTAYQAQLLGLTLPKETQGIVVVAIRDCKRGRHLWSQPRCWSADGYGVMPGHNPDAAPDPDAQKLMVTLR